MAATNFIDIAALANSDSFKYIDDIIGRALMRHNLVFIENWSNVPQGTILRLRAAIAQCDDGSCRVIWM